ncbi:hypothetical protein D6774_02565 [Candidatus Woesearchaeota archaeon]|jgi:uncharacterized protein (UPF0147 family)|nr:MAG: hypothetical protein D6774_02565 [Candidatus Woesearchaeota archaeon]
MSEVFDSVIDALLDIQEDEGVPKSVISKIDELLNLLESDEDEQIIINKVLFELDELGNNSNIPQHIRTQLFHVVSMLEAI